MRRHLFSLVLLIICVVTLAAGISSSNFLLPFRVFNQPLSLSLIGTVDLGTGPPDVTKMPLRDIKKELNLRDVDCTGCTERAEFEEALRENWGETIKLTPTQMPHPQKNTGPCGTDVASWICDPNRVIDDAARADLVNFVQGTPYAVVLVDKMLPAYVEKHGALHMSSEHFAKSLFRTWGLAADAVLVFLSVKDGVMFMEPGNKVAPKLTDQIMQVFPCVCFFCSFFFCFLG
jgi:hypothetical protein